MRSAKTTSTIALIGLSILAILSFSGVWGEAVEEDIPERLIRDAGFDRIQLGSALPGSQPVTAFAVSRDRIFYVQNSFTDRPKVVVLALNEDKKVRVVKQDALPEWSPVSTTFHLNGQRLAFFDAKAQKLVEVHPQSKELERVATGLIVVGSFGRFHTGKVLADSGNMMEVPISDFSLLEGVLSDEEAQRIANRCKRGRVFVTDTKFTFEKVVLPSFNGLTAQRSNRRDRFLGRYNVRMDPRQQGAAVYSKHLPGIHLVSDQGEVVKVIKHPGQGREITAGHPLADMLGEGTRFLYQTDVLLGLHDLLVSDLASGRLWQFDLRTGESRSFLLPYDVQRMQRDGDFLYLLGMEGRLERFRYPKWKQGHS